MNNTNQETSDTNLLTETKERQREPEREEQTEEAAGENQALQRIQQRVAQLEQREQALALAERKLKALEGMRRLGLPENALDCLDLESDQGLERSLKLADGLQAMFGSVPPAGTPSVLACNNYTERARLFQINPQGYQSMVQQERSKQ